MSVHTRTSANCSASWSITSAGAAGGRKATRRPLRAAGARRLRRRLAARSTICRRSRPRCDRRHPQDHHPQQLARYLASTARSIPIAAASMAASIASRGRPTPISACRPGSISNPDCSPSRTRRSCWPRNCRRPATSPKTIAIGTNTDPYQPIEKKISDHAPHPRGAARFQTSGRHRHQIAAGAARHRHPRADGERKLARVALSVTTLDRKLARTMEPRAATPPRRLEAMRRWSQAGIPTAVMFAPVIPALNDMRDGTHARRRRGRRRARGRLCAAAPAARDERPVPRMAEANFPDR